MKLMFLPHVREGIAPTSSAGGRAQASIGLRLESPGRQARDVSRVMTLLGPGDVVAIESRQVLRVTPAGGTRDAEPEFFPSIEFDAPDLPWTYSPAVTSGTRVLPWLALIVVEATSDVTIVAGQQGQSPQILRLSPSVASRELPDLADSWAWAHAQVACENRTQIAQTLANHPDRTLSRLLSPRRLLPFRPYLACVVPAFLSGRIAGLGRDPASEATIVTGQEPAWSATDIPTELPVYYSWSFRTGDAGDFESLAQRLHGTPPDASIPTTPLHLALPNGDGSLTVDWEPPLRVKGQRASTNRRPAAALAQIRTVLTASSPAQPVLGPSYFGSPWIDGRPLDPLTQWAPSLNLTPMFRAAASLGAEAVRGEQDALVAAASEQLEVFRAKQREGRRKQLAATFQNRVKLRLSVAPVTETARVFAPLAVSTQLTSASVGLLTTAGRRVLRKAVVGPTTNVTPAGTATRATTATRTFTLAAASSSTTRLNTSVLVRNLPTLKVTGEIASMLVAPIVYQPAVVLEPVKDVRPPVAPVDATSIETGEFAPRFARPMSEPLADRFPELMLPGGGSIEPDGVMLVESDQAFVEAFLVGANQELNYELLWRRLPASMRATAFRRFWGHADGSDDIDAITTWNANSDVGSHVKSSASMVLVVRSELVRRYPSVLVAAVPAAWKNGNRVPMENPPQMVLPAFRGRIGADVLYAGFSRPSIADAIGTTTENGPAGWFLLLSENPGDARFGLDPAAGTAPPTRATLSWGHLSPAPTRPYASIGSIPHMSDVGFTPANATAATVANLVRQRPFRAFLHASLLIRLGA